MRLAELACQEFALNAKTDPPPLIPSETAVFQDDGKLIFKLDCLPLIAYAGKPSLKTLESSEEASDCILKHDAAGLLKIPQASDPVLLTKETTRPFFFSQLMSPILEAMESIGSVQPPRELLLETYRRYRHVWTARERTYQVTAPLLNFESDIAHSPRFSLASLSRLSGAEKNRRFPLPSNHDSIGLEDFARSSFALIGSFREASVHDASRSRDAFGEEVRQIVTALRLLHEGSVRIRYNFFSIIERVKYGDLPPSVGYLKTDPPIVPYVLDPPELPKLFELRNQVAGASGQLRMALDRFEFSYERVRREDRLVDLVIALEASLLGGTKIDRKRKTLSDRGALLVGSMPKIPNPKKFFKSLYDVRSLIVHSGFDLSHPEVQKLMRSVATPVESFSQLSENLTREVLCRYLQRLAAAKTLPEVNADLDRANRNTWRSRIWWPFRR